METMTVSTNMIYEFLKEFKSEVYNRFEQIDNRFEQVDKRFEQVDKRFEQVDKRFEQIEKRIDRIEYQQLDDRKMLMDIWQSRDKVTVHFPKGFAGINAFISGLISAIVAFLVK